jgi:hypothetical protein
MPKSKINAKRVISQNVCFRSVIYKFIDKFFPNQALRQRVVLVDLWRDRRFHIASINANDKWGVQSNIALIRQFTCSVEEPLNIIDRRWPL